MDKTCLGNNPNAYQNSNGQWKVDTGNWINVCKCPECFDKEREAYLNYLNTLGGLDQKSKKFLMGL